MIDCDVVVWSYETCKPDSAYMTDIDANARYSGKMKWLYDGQWRNGVFIWYMERFDYEADCDGAIIILIIISMNFVSNVLNSYNYMNEPSIDYVTTVCYAVITLPNWRIYKKGFLCNK